MNEIAKASPQEYVNALPTVLWNGRVSDNSYNQNNILRHRLLLLFLVLLRGAGVLLFICFFCFFFVCVFVCCC